MLAEQTQRTHAKAEVSKYIKYMANGFVCVCVCTVFVCISVYVCLCVEWRQSNRWDTWEKSEKADRTAQIPEQRNIVYSSIK